MIDKKLLIYIIFMVIGVIFNISILMFSSIIDVFSCVVSISIISLVITISTYKTYQCNDIFQPITIINTFLFFMFVLRPIKLLSMKSLTEASYFRYYFLTHRYYSISELPFALAFIIGLIGVVAINAGYWVARQKTKYRKLTITPYISSQEKIRTTKQWINIYICFAVLVWAYYICKSFWGGDRVTYSTIDILWIYVFCVAVLLEQIITKKINAKIWAILMISILSFSILGNRQHIVNLLLCVFIPYSYMNKKSINTKTIFLSIIMMLVIVWYGTLRRGSNFTLDTIFEYFLGEFAMFDMLVLGLKHQITFNDPFYYGYNYLCFLNYIIPSLNIEYFDFMHVQVVFNGLIGGGIPTSIIGSLYFNFSYIGTVLGGLIIGVFIGYRYNKCVEMNTSFSIAYYSMFLTFVYDITRVGDIGREIVNYLILFGCFKIAILFIGEGEKRFHNIRFKNIIN